MHCPFCQHGDTKVLDSRIADEGASIRRRRACAHCEKRFTTIEQMQLMVVKRSGATEPFVSLDPVLALGIGEDVRFGPVVHLLAQARLGRKGVLAIGKGPDDQAGLDL